MRWGGGGGVDGTLSHLNKDLCTVGLCWFLWESGQNYGLELVIRITGRSELRRVP